jgi:hypothetical protein
MIDHLVQHRKVEAYHKPQQGASDYCQPVVPCSHARLHPLKIAMLVPHAQAQLRRPNMEHHRVVAIGRDAAFHQQAAIKR